MNFSPVFAGTGNAGGNGVEPKTMPAALSAPDSRYARPRTVQVAPTGPYLFRLSSSHAPWLPRAAPCGGYRSRTGDLLNANQVL